MNEPLLAQVQKAIHDILEVNERLRLLHASPRVHAILKIALITKLGDDIAVINGAVDIQAPHDIGMFAHL